jgi:hypothetical protein
MCFTVERCRASCKGERAPSASGSRLSKMDRSGAIFQNVNCLSTTLRSQARLSRDLCSAGSKGHAGERAGKTAGPGDAAVRPGGSWMKAPLAAQ